MKDPHVHVEHDIAIMTHAEIRMFLARTTGLVVDMPKTVRTGCNVRRPYAMTSLIPAHVTCLPCREYAVRTYTERATLAQTALSLNLGTLDERALIQDGMAADIGMAEQFSEGL